MSIQDHVEFKTACRHHILGIPLTGKSRQKHMDTSFDAQCTISQELKVPLYDVMMAVRAYYFSL